MLWNIVRFRSCYCCGYSLRRKIVGLNIRVVNFHQAEIHFESQNSGPWTTKFVQIQLLAQINIRILSSILFISLTYSRLLLRYSILRTFLTITVDNNIFRAFPNKSCPKVNKPGHTYIIKYTICSLIAAHSNIANLPDNIPYSAHGKRGRLFQLGDHISPYIYKQGNILFTRKTRVFISNDKCMKKRR